MIQNMKKSIYLLVLVVAFMASSCKSINDLLVVKVDTEFEVSIPLETETTPLKSGTPLYAFRGEKSLDPLNNEDLVDFKNKIKQIAVNGIGIRFSTPELGEIKISDWEIGFWDKNGNGLSYDFGDLSINEGISELVSTLDDKASFEYISDYLTSGPMTIRITGKVDKPGITMEAFFSLASTVFVGL